MRFTRPDAGELSIDGKQVENLPLSKREVGFVFQSYALFPTHTVAQNIGFSLSIRRRSRSEIDERVRELCELTRLSGLEARYPHDLSGGQQQRVALARALAPNPAILLLDEPLSALDAKIRGHLRAEIRRVVDRLGITTVYVTHDQEEALSISDRVAVMSDGAIQQVGRPMEVYLTPATRVVADFIGTTNYLVGRPARNGVLEAEGHLVAGAVPVGSEERARCVDCVRPEHLELFPDDHADGAGGTIVFHSFLGQSVRANVETGSGVIVAQVLSFLPPAFIIMDNVLSRHDGRVEEAAASLVVAAIGGPIGGVLAGRAVLQRLDASVDEAAEILGASLVQRFTRVVMPMMRHAAILGTLYLSPVDLDAVLPGGAQRARDLDRGRGRPSLHGLSRQ